MGIGQGRPFRDAVVRRRLVIGGGGADIDILPGFPAEKPVVALRLVTGEPDELADRVEGHPFEFLSRVRLIADIRDDLPDARGDLRLPVPAVQQPDLPVRLRRKPADNPHADGSRSSDEQRLHLPAPPCLCDSLSTII